MSGGSLPFVRHTIQLIAFAYHYKGIIRRRCQYRAACCGKTFQYARIGMVCGSDIWTSSVLQLYRTAWYAGPIYGRPLYYSCIVRHDDEMHTVRTTYGVLFSLVSCEVAHCLDSIPGMMQQRRRRDGQDSQDAITSVLMVVSPPLSTHRRTTRFR